jgi:hypothetical protein
MMHKTVQKQNKRLMKTNPINKKQNDKKGPENKSSHINEESGQNLCGGFTGYVI